MTYRAVQMEEADQRDRAIQGADQVRRSTPSQDSRARELRTEPISPAVSSWFPAPRAYPALTCPPIRARASQPVGEPHVHSGGADRGNGVAARFARSRSYR